MKKDIIIEGNCIDILPSLLEDSIDAIVTDPPAGIAFMGKEWDKDKGGRDQWIAWMSQVAAECIRVIKPGGHALVWALPRTSHWTGMAWEEAGWEPRDKLAHVFGSGFPKSLDISKKLDQMAGAEREVIGQDPERVGRLINQMEHSNPTGTWQAGKRCVDITSPATPAAIQWAGFGTALKPAHEDWWLFRKPLACKTIAENVLEWGCGGLNIDSCRIGFADKDDSRIGKGYSHNAMAGLENGEKDNSYGNKIKLYKPTGRFPSNLIWSHSPLCKRIGTKKVKGDGHYPKHKKTIGDGNIYGKSKPFDAEERFLTEEEVETWDCHPSCPSWEFAKAGNCGGGNHTYRRPKPAGRKGHIYGAYDQAKEETVIGKGDSGSASRFFKSCQFTEEDLPAFAYYAKASKSERGEGNNHPTVKSLSLMRYLVKLITPPNGLILDPFTGSGTTLLAAKQEGFHYIGIEKEHDYVEIANARIASSINSNSNNIIIKPKIELHKKSKTLFDF